MNVFVDYEILHTCQFPVDLFTRPDKQISCDLPALYRVYWLLEDGISDEEMFVCRKHLDIVMEREKEFADYENLHTCKFPVSCSSCAEMETDCGAPAIYRVYWTLEDGTEAGGMLVCQKHFDFIMECEKQPEEG